jgi:hypothetical protein
MHQTRNIRAVANDPRNKTRSTTCPARKVRKDGTRLIFVTLNAFCKIASGRLEIVRKLAEPVSDTARAFPAGLLRVVNPYDCASFGKPIFHVAYDSICKVGKAPETARNTHRSQVWSLNVDGKILQGTASTTCAEVRNDLQVFFGFFARCNRF